jgi:adenylate cyclase
MWPVAVTVVSLAAIGVGGFLYFTKLETSAPSKVAARGSFPSSFPSSVASSAPSAVATASPSPAPPAMAAATPAPTATVAPTSPMVVSSEKFAAANIPFIGDKARTTLASDYAPAADFKAFSLNVAGLTAFVAGQPSEEVAKSAAVEQCQKRADAVQSPRKCELYAVGDTVVYTHGRPPMPPLPWIRHDAATEQPFVAKNVPLTRDGGKARLEAVYAPARKPKALAVGPGGAFFFPNSADSVEEAVRRALESCGGIAGAPCMIIALNDNFVVPIPASLKITGFFKPAGNTMISADARDDVARRLADASSGWNAVAVGAAGRPGLGLRAATEQDAVNGALAECVKRDGNCQVIAIGPFSVEPN